MLCQVCAVGETRTGVTSVPLQLHGTMVLVRGVPSDICDACSNFFIDFTTRRELLRTAHEALDRGESAVEFRPDPSG